MATYQAGSAFLNILPSFADFPRQLARGFGQAVGNGLVAPVALAPNARQFLAEIDAMEARIPPGNVAMHADISRLRAEVQSAGSSVGGLDVPLTADEARLRAQLQHLGSGIPPVVVPVEADEKGFKDQLSKLGPAAGAALGAGLVAGIASGMSSQDLAAQFTAKLGTTQARSADLGKLAGQIYAENYGDSASDVAASLQSTLSTNFGKGLSTDELKTYTENALTVSGTFEQDMGGITNSVQQMITTGLVKNGNDALDLLTKGFQGGADKAGDLLDTFNEYGTQFRKLGLDGPTALGLIQQGLQGGARDGDLAADALKEFSIRAVDGSTTSAQGFEAIGLNAKQMTAQIAQGGPGAARGLQQVLDGLKTIKDPAAQAAAATSLFGTQAEDLGAALYSFDPSTAAQGLGDVAGAAQNANNALGTTASARIETFKRSLQTTFSQTLGGVVLPALTTFSNFLAPLTGMIGGTGNAVLLLAVPLVALAGAWAAVTAAQKIYQGAMAVWSAATKVWTGIQAAFNFVLNANPIGIIVIAIIALIAIIVIAYTKSDTFRAIVQAAWAGIKTAVAVAWSYIKIVFGALVAFFSVAGPAALGIFKTVITTAWGAIHAVISFAWGIIKGIFGLFTAGLHLVGAAGAWLWHSAIQPAFNGISSAISEALSLARGAMNLFRGAMSGIGSAASALWHGPLSTAWNGIKSVILGVIHVIQGAIDKLLAAFDSVAAGADKVKGAVGKVTGTPGKVLGKVKGLIPGFATGGIYPGYTPGRDIGYIGVSGGEAIMRPEWTRAIGYDNVYRMNAVAARGGVGGVRKYLGGYATGGIVGVDTAASSSTSRDTNFHGPVNAFNPRELARIVNEEQRRTDALIPAGDY